MPSASPGNQRQSAPLTGFVQLLPGAPTQTLQAFATFAFRFKRYVAYVSGPQLNILSSPTTLVQAIRLPHDLTAIAAEQQTGKLAVAGKKHLWLLEPRTEGWTKIWWERTLLLRREDAGDEAQWLSWGSDGEVLVGGSRVLSLFSTLPSSRTASPAILPVDGHVIEERRALWSRPVASPIRQAEFSPSASLIASCSTYDRLVKIWRRLSYEEGLFDYTYIPHPGVVTHLEWQVCRETTEESRDSSSNGRHSEDGEVLYTIAIDAILRIWRTGSMHDADILFLYTTVDLIGAIPQSPTSAVKGQSPPSKAPRHAVILPSDQFCAAVHAAIGLPQTDQVSHSKELLKEMVSQQPEIVVVFDGQGRMSAWGLQSIGHKRRTQDPATQPYHIAHAEALPLKLPAGGPAVCRSWFHDDQIHLLAHSLSSESEIIWWRGDVEAFFSSSNTTVTESLSPLTTWCGHDSDIVHLQMMGNGLISRSSNEVTQWRMDSAKSLTPRRSYGITHEVLAAILLRGGSLLLTATASEFNLWNDSGRRIAKASCEISQSGDFLVLSNAQGSISGVFIEHDAQVIISWTTAFSEGSTIGNGHVAAERIFNDEQNLQDISFAVPVSMPFGSGKSCLIRCSKTGLLSRHSISEKTSTDTEFEHIALVESGVSAPEIFAASEEFAALVPKPGKSLVIVDLIDGYVEDQQFSSRTIEQLKCFTPRPRHNFLAVGYDTAINILAQGRYEHHSSGVPVWNFVRTISIADTGLENSAMSWISDGGLALAAGNSVFLTGPTIEWKDVGETTREMFDFGTDAEVSFHLTAFTNWLKEPLPAWHPSLLSHVINSGHPGLVARLLKRLAQKLKFWGSGEELHPTLNEPPEILFQNLEQQDTWLDVDTVKDLREQLEEKELPRISHAEQQRLKHVVEAIVYLKDHVNGLDRNALRYLFHWKLQLLIAGDKSRPQDTSAQLNGAHPPADFVPDMQWRELCFANHSSTQQPLLDILALHHDNKLTWPIARRLGIMAWLSDHEALEQVFEQLGQTAYRADQPPDPVNATLYYLALHKKPTLLALWRIATWHKEQRTTMNFLKREFGQPDAKTAAKKNAYALMGKRRFHYSAAFFLLADDPASATSILAGQCEDPALAIAVARLYCGDGSPVVRKLLEDRIMPQATQDGNRWLLSWCHTVLLEKARAVDILVQPLPGVKTWHRDDPIRLWLYRQLRGPVASEHEYDAVLRSARLLRRMGLWLLALELVRNWGFKPMHYTTQPVSSSAHPPVADSNGIPNGIHGEPTHSLLDDFAAASPTASPSAQQASERPPSMLDAFTTPQNQPDPPSPPAPTSSDDKASRAARAAELLKKMKAKKEAATPLTSAAISEKKREPTQFKEPDPNSLLDQFGF